MPTTTLTSKGQITIPLEVRTALGLHAGAKLDFVLDQDGFRVVPLRNLAPSKPVSLAAMDEAIAAEAAARETVPGTDGPA